MCSYNRCDLENYLSSVETCRYFAIYKLCCLNVFVFWLIKIWYIIFLHLLSSFPCISSITIFHFRVYDTEPFVPFVSQINPIHVLTFYFFKIEHNFIFLQSQGLLNSLFPSVSPPKYHDGVLSKYRVSCECYLTICLQNQGRSEWISTCSTAFIHRKSSL